MDEPRAQTAAGHLTIDLLGTLSVRNGRSEVPVGPAMVRNLLAVLALQPGRVIPRDELAQALWDGSPPATHINLLQVYASRLRAQLRCGSPPGTNDSVVQWEHGGYRLDLPAKAVDLVRFERLLGEARDALKQGRTDVAARCYDVALRCWRGPTLADASPGVRLLPAVARAERLRLEAAVEQATLHCATGRPRAAVEVLEPMAASAPLHEGLHAHLIEALANAGNRAGALAVYSDLRRRLSEELGVDPSPDLQSRYLRLLRTRAEVTAEPDVSVVGAESDPDPAPRRRRFRPVAIAASAAIALVLLAPALARLPALRTRPATPVPAGFNSTVHWRWVYGPSLGRTPANDQWASADVAGLGADDCAGFRFRVGDNPEGEGDDQGLLLAVCGSHWEIEAQEADFAHGDISAPPAGVLLASVSVDNVVTVSFDGRQLVQRRLHGRYLGGTGISPALWQGEGRVTVSGVRSNAIADDDLDG